MLHESYAGILDRVKTNIDLSQNIDGSYVSWHLSADNCNNLESVQFAYKVILVD